MDESRKQFESCFVMRYPGQSSLLQKNHDGNYVFSSTENQWYMWQSSRAAIEIQTPDLVGDDDNSLTEYDEGYNRGIILCDNAIIEHGIKVKVNG